MNRIMRMARWVVTGAVALAFAVAAAVFIFTHTSRFNDLLRTRIVAYLDQTYRGQITIGAIEGSIWGSLTLRNINVHHRGLDIASIPELHLGYYLLPALRGKLVVSGIDVIRPQVRLAHDPDGQWNIVAALTEREPSPPINLTIALHHVGIEHANISAEIKPATIYRINDANLSGSASLGLSRKESKIDTFSFGLNGPRFLPMQVQGSIDYVEAAQIATIKVPSLSLLTAHSQIELHGALRDLSARNIEATIKLRKLAATDVNSMVPRIKLARDLSGTIDLNGAFSHLNGVISLAAGDAHLQSKATADLSQPRPTWRIQTNLFSIDLRKLVESRELDQLPDGEINASLHANGVGASLAAVTGGLDGHISGLAFRRLKLGELSVNATLDRQMADLKALLTGPGGRAQVDGRINLTQVPAYKLTLALAHLQPSNFVQTARVPSADLGLTAMIDGAGYQANTTRAHLQVQWLPSRFGAIRIERGRIDAQLASGMVQIADASFQARNTTVTVKGEIALDPSRQGRLRYQLSVGQVADWLALVGRKGTGRLSLTGQAEGTLRRIRAWGSAQLAAIQVARYSVSRADLTYDVAGLGETLRPDGKLMLVSSGLHAGIGLKSLQTTILLVAGATETAKVDLAAEDQFSHSASLRADVTYRAPTVMLDLTRLDIATNDGSWQLDAPAQITQRGRSLEVRRFVASNRTQTIALRGTLAQSGPQDFALRVQRLRLATFSGFLPARLNPAGIASADLSVRGSAEAPVIDVAVNVSDLKMVSLPQAGLSARLSYADGRARGDAIFYQDPAHSLSATAELPVLVDWARGFESKVTGDVDVRVVTSGLDLAVLNALRNPQLSTIGGMLTLDISAHGPLEHPIPRGYIRLVAGHALAKTLKVDVNAASADIELQPGAVRLASLTARAGNGTLSGGGSLSLGPDGSPRRLDVRIALDQWPAIATHEYNATINELIDVTGPLDAIHIGGRIDVLYGVFRPDLSIAGGAPRPDNTIVVVHQWTAGIGGHPPLHLAKPQPAAAPELNSLAIDLDIMIHRDTWIKTADFAVDLEGNINVHKKRGGEMILTGTINAVHGVLIVAQHQFDLTRGQIMLTGGHEINPQLDLVARLQVPNYLLFATIAGTANKPTLTLSSIPELPQADILSMMMFGKTTNNLTGSQQKDLQNQAISMAGGYAASQIGRAVAQSLGLSELGLSTNTAGVGIGRYLTKNVYISASQSPSSMNDRKAQIQYYLTPGISLDTSASTNYGNEIKLQWHKDY